MQTTADKPTVDIGSIFAWLKESKLYEMLYAGKITESYDVIQEWESVTEKKHPLSASVRKAIEIMRQHRLKDKDIEQTFDILFNVLDRYDFHIQSADFHIETYKKTNWIYYNFHLDLATPELFPRLETELHVRLSSELEPEIFEAFEIDITADKADSLQMTQEISDVITSNDALMERINKARQGMREGVPGLSYEEVFGK